MSFVLYGEEEGKKNIDTTTAPVYIHALQEFSGVSSGHAVRSVHFHPEEFSMSESLSSSVAQ